MSATVTTIAHEVPPNAGLRAFVRKLRTGDEIGRWRLMNDAERLYVMREILPTRKLDVGPHADPVVMDELQAALLSIKLTHLERWLSERQAIAAGYIQRLTGVGDLVLPVLADDATHVYHVFVARTKRRSELQEYLTQNGVGTLIHYPVPPHLQQAYQVLGHRKGDFPIAEEIADTCLSLPLWPGMPESALERVTSLIIEFFKAG